MKKTILFIVTALVLVSVLTASAQVPSDLKSLSDAQLRQLSDMVQKEISRRGLSAVDLTLREGKYIVGKDIPAGEYKFTCIETEGESLSSSYSSLGNAYDSLLGSEGGSWGSLFGALGNMMEEVSEMKIEVLGDYGDVLQSVTLKKDAFTTLTLREGTAVQISEGSCKVQSK